MGFKIVEADQLPKKKQIATKVSPEVEALATLRVGQGMIFDPCPDDHGMVDMKSCRVASRLHGYATRNKIKVSVYHTDNGEKLCLIRLG